MKANLNRGKGIDKIRIRRLECYKTRSRSARVQAFSDMAHTYCAASITAGDGAQLLFAREDRPRLYGGGRGRGRRHRESYVLECDDAGCGESGVWGVGIEGIERCATGMLTI